MTISRAALLKFSQAWVEQDMDTILNAISDDFQFCMGNCDKPIKGKAAFADWLKNMKCEDGKSSINHKDLILTEEQAALTGEIHVSHGDEHSRYAFCDVYRFANDKIISLTAYCAKFDNES